MNAIIKSLESATPAACAPEPLRRPTPPPEPYPLAELGEVLAPAAEAIRRVIQAPDAIIGGALLAAASLATQAQADVHLDGRVIPLSLWLLSVAESGERKSAVDGEAMQAAREYERELSKAYGEDCDRHAADLAEWEARRDAVRGEAKQRKGDGLAAKLQALGAGPPAPLLPRVTAADFTAEGLFKLLSAGRPTIGAFTDEAALVFGGHGMAKETVMRTAGTLCKLWDRGELDRVRSGDGAAKLYGRRFALHLLAQPVIAERALSDDVLAGQGFLARCLLAWPEGTAGTRPYQAVSLRDDPAMQRLRARLLYLHRLALPLAEGERQELAPRALRLSADAFAYWRTVHDTVEGQCGPGGRFAQVKPWASKTAEQALRIAGVLTLVEAPDAQVIEVGTVERAAELALWHLNEAVRLAGTAALSPEVRDAEALLQWAHATGRSYLHSREALRLGPSRIRERDTFERAIGELVRAGWAEPVEGGMHLDGAHRRHAWRIVPASEGR
ncbi:YfjI family protein [Vulcaniibacterium gelatinicum]|uniref:YfjI family protein n=1 Tax=Vulcaniibacterium gelatinicum TaxID=2598725 RepID=UPI0011CB1B8C|nr:YfjI family protein [Vulcaniibacterium gelatinicum]